MAVAVAVAVAGLRMKLKNYSSKCFKNPAASVHILQNNGIRKEQGIYDQPGAPFTYIIKKKQKKKNNSSEIFIRKEK